MNASKHFNTHRFVFVECAHYPVSLHISLFAAGDVGWVNLVMRCSQKWACVFHFVFHVPALPWVHLSFEAAPRLKEPRLPACVCAFVRGRKRGRETVKGLELRAQLLWSHRSVANVMHLFVRTSDVPTQVWIGVKSEQHRKSFFTAAIFSVVFLPLNYR